MQQCCAYIDPYSSDGRTDGWRLTVSHTLKWVKTAKFEYQLIAHSYLIEKSVNARYLSKIVRPAEILSKLFTQNNMNPVIKEDSDED